GGSEGYGGAVHGASPWSEPTRSGHPRRVRWTRASQLLFPGCPRRGGGPRAGPGEDHADRHPGGGSRRRRHRRRGRPTGRGPLPRLDRRRCAPRARPEGGAGERVGHLQVPAGVRLERDLKVADALSGTSLGGVTPPVLGFVKLTEGGRCAVTEAPVGRPLMLDDLAGGPDLARSLGQVLARIHTVPRYAAEAAGVESFTAEVLHAEHRTRIREVTEAGHLPAAVAQRWQALLEDEELWDFTPQFVHGDLSEESLFVTGQQISA